MVVVAVASVPEAGDNWDVLGNGVDATGEAGNGTSSSAVIFPGVMEAGVSDVWQSSD